MVRYRRETDRQRQVLVDWWSERSRPPSVGGPHRPAQCRQHEDPPILDLGFRGVQPAEAEPQPARGQVEDMPTPALAADRPDSGVAELHGHLRLLGARNSPGLASVDHEHVSAP